MKNRFLSARINNPIWPLFTRINVIDALCFSLLWENKIKIIKNNAYIYANQQSVIFSKYVLRSFSLRWLGIKVASVLLNMKKKKVKAYFFFLLRIKEFFKSHVKLLSSWSILTHHYGMCFLLVIKFPEEKKHII